MIDDPGKLKHTSWTLDLLFRDSSSSILNAIILSENDIGHMHRYFSYKYM